MHRDFARNIRTDPKKTGIEYCGVMSQSLWCHWTVGRDVLGTPGGLNPNDPLKL